MRPLIEIKELSFSYRGSAGTAVSEVNLNIYEGEFVVLCGPTGSGKSTLLRLLKPAIAPKGSLSGTVSFMGQQLSEYSDRDLAQKIGFVMQSTDHQIVCDKVWHELAFGLESVGTAPDVMRRRIAETAGYFGLEPLFDRDVETLSGGQKQILALASVMVMKPDVLILDEPVSQLDSASAEKFLGCLKRLNDDFGVTVILAEHRIDEVVTFADRLVVMDKGKVICADAPDKAGAFLRDSKSPLFALMPEPMRLCGNVDSERLPLTVKEARKLMAQSAEGEHDALMDRDIPEGSVTLTGGSITADSKHKKEKTILTCRDLCFGYDAKDIIKDLKLDVYPGEILGLMGANGCGKSTLLSLMARINKARSGKIEFKGKDIRRSKDAELYKDGIAMLPQDPQTLFSKDTVHDEIYDMVRNLNLEMPADEIAAGLMDTMELKDLADRHPYDLSGGEQQRLALAMVLAARPKLILMDEPTKGLDAIFKSRLSEDLKKLRDNGISMIIVSHDSEFCATCCDRCALMFRGEIITVSKAEEFFRGNMFLSTAASRITAGRNKYITER